MLWIKGSDLEAKTGIPGQRYAGVVFVVLAGVVHFKQRAKRGQ